MQTIVTDVCGVCQFVRQSVCLSRGFTVRELFGAAFSKSLWPLVLYLDHTFR